MKPRSALAQSLPRSGIREVMDLARQMDAVIVDGPAIDLIRVGAETIRAVVKKGEVVHEAHRSHTA